jgi:tetratricopeptide (TPR) repeat protein
MVRDAAKLATKVQQAIALHDSGQLVRAGQIYQEILSDDPGHTEALGKLAALTIQAGNPGAAVRLLDSALLNEPDNAIYHCNRGAALERLRQWDAALHSYEQAIVIKPDLPEAHCNRANVLRELRQLPGALAGYDRAIALKPGYVNAYINRGKVLMDLGQPDAALDSYNRAIALNPDNADVYYNRAVLLGRMSRPDEAIASYDQAIAIRPGFSSAYFNRALASLLSGRYEQGWADYEWRWQNERIQLSRERRNFPQPRWTGAEPVSGQTIFIYGEQGLGDTIQFCRYVPLLAARGARVILEAQKPLVGLMGSLAGVAEVVAQGDPLRDFDYHCALMSLPLAFRTTVATIPAPLPYLRSDPERTRAWRDILGQQRKIRVGIVWSSGVRPNEPQLLDLCLRNIPLARLAALRHPDIEFYSLQKGQPAESELANLAAGNSLDFPIIDLTRRLNDFADTAALMENLDLVISVDTATAHLAGALGKPVWILACFNACWRWLQDRTDSPWYPTARLYRQPASGDWDYVIRHVSADLVKFVNRAGARGHFGQS